MYRIILFLTFVMTVSAANASDPVAEAKKLIQQGLHKDALDILRPWVLDPTQSGGYPARYALEHINECLKKLNRINEIDELLEKAAEVHKAHFVVLDYIAQIYSRYLPTHGTIIDGKFQRDLRRGGGQWIDTAERDRVRALQLYVQAMPLALKSEQKGEAALFFRMFAMALQNNDRRHQTWKLQSLTDLTILPDYETQRYWGGNQSKAPVDADGNPVYYYVPESFESAKNDGERWRWCLDQSTLYESTKKNKAYSLVLQTEFFESQFGVQTLSSFDFLRNRINDTEKTASILTLETLTDEETIAQLASGIKRFKLPDEFNYIALWKKIYEEGGGTDKLRAGRKLAEIYTNRRQFDRAVHWYQQLFVDFPDWYKNESRSPWQDKLDQILKNWGRFDNAGSSVAGLKAELRYTFRNGKKVNLTVRKVNVEKLIADIKEYLKAQPKKVDWQKIQIDQIGQRLIFGDNQNNGNANNAAEVRKKYIDETVAEWSINLEPAEKHFDRSTMITFENKRAGAYLLRAEMEGGNAENVLIWLHDTAIVKKQLNNSVLYFVADAETGQPIPSAKVNFFGYNAGYKDVPAGNNRTRQEPDLTWTFQEQSHQTDDNGFVIFEPRSGRQNLNWLITVSDKKSQRFTHLGFNNMWFAERHDEQYNTVKVFVMTDRPVYRPKDKVQIKTWIGTAKYDKPNTNEWAGKEIQYTIYDPRGEKIAEKANVKLDEYGGFVTEYELPKDAMLGVYQFSTGSGGGNFRVEEYKKPEYEVTVDAPKEPVALGEKISATIKAKYYFGSPVTEATVKYKVLREKANADWYPIRPWDWFYGCGYAWFAYDADWLPGWNSWGVRRPVPPWFPRHSGPPEVVSEQEVKISADGTVNVTIDTEIAQAIYPGDDQRYTITAEVVDNSRRTIVGSGSVLVTKEPFKIYAWTDRGYYVPNQKIAANFQARRLDGKPVSGEGEVKLFKLNYVKSADGSGVKVNEQQLHTEAVKFNDEGSTTMTLNAAEAGQYRISCTLNDQEGGYVFNVYANEKAAGKDWKFNSLELIPDKAEFAPGENVTLKINTDRSNSSVLLFVKPANGVAAGKPQLLRLKGQSSEVSIPVEQRDMPNFFVEALTVSGGEIVSETKEIVVPPQQRVLNVEVKPSAENYKPGGKAKAELIVTDMDGKPVVGQMVVSIYDKSVEYISGGSNVGNIKEFFWKWRRYHSPNTAANLNKRWYGMPDPDKPRMEILGLFGNVQQFADGTANSNSIDLKGIAVGIPMAAPSSGVGGMGGSSAEALTPSAAPAFSRKLLETADSITMMIEPRIILQESEEQFVEPTVRKNFADTALWIGALETDKNGIAQIELDMPESLTTWKINVWTMALGTRVGYGNAEVITRKDLILRMQTPRFLIEKDKVVLSANVHNYLSNEKEVKVELEVVSGQLSVVSNNELTASRSSLVTIPPNAEERIDWLVEAKSVGDAVIRMKAITDEESDAVEKTLPVYVHGMLKQDSFSAFLPPQKESTSFEIDVPAERKPEQTKLTVRFSPTLAASMVDALPFLTDYPYGCTEQTLNRFLPTVIVRKVIGDGFDLGRDEKPNWAIARKRNPVFDKEQIDAMVREGTTKLTNMQNSDGGWGWFGGYGSQSSAHLTALVVHGLHLAQQNDVAVNDDVINSGTQWLIRVQQEQVELLENALLPDNEKENKSWKEHADEADAFVLMVLSERGGDVKSSQRMTEYLWRDRGKLSPYGVAMFGIALGKDKRIAECTKIIEQYLVQDEENQTAYLNLSNYGGWCWWAWHGSEFETQAYYLKLLMRSDPKSPIAPRLVKYLLNNRRHATYWNSTRDTAICIEAFAEFLKTTGENKPNVTVEVLVDGEVKKTVEFTPDNFMTVDGTLVLEKDQVTTGKHQIELRKKGTNPLYITVYLENFSLEDPIKKAGLEVKIERRFYLLVPEESATAQTAGSRGQVVERRIEKYKREPLASGAQVQSGALIEVELVLESKNDYESLLIEDRKIAGFEPVDVRSGYNGNALGAYVEFRDERVVFFAERLTRGKHSVSYRLRAEQPGAFSALPAGIEAMYAPELKGNSDEAKINVGESQ